MNMKSLLILLACILLAAPFAVAKGKGKKKAAPKAEETTEPAEGEAAAAPEDAPAPVEPPEEAAVTPETPGTAEAPETTTPPPPVETEPTYASEDFSIDKIIKALKALKGKIAQSEKRMNDIVSVVLSSAETKGSRINLIHRSDMSPDFKLVEATFSLDGAPIYKKSDDDGIMIEKEIGIYDGAILPGDHKLSVTLVFRGHGYGILSYLSKYKFKVRSSHSFSVQQGKGIQLTVIGFEKGDVNTKLEDRPAIKYSEKSIGME
jgi:hypothetical protein